MCEKGRMEREGKAGFTGEGGCVERARRWEEVAGDQSKRPHSQSRRGRLEVAGLLQEKEGRIGIHRFSVN